LRLRSIWLFHCSNCRRFSISATDTPAAALLPAKITAKRNWQYSYSQSTELVWGLTFYRVLTSSKYKYMKSQYKTEEIITTIR
jgi:hypothetical protein